jgi:CrcB protein
VTLFVIFLAGGAGCVARYLLGQFVQTRSHSGFPFGTLVVNLVGCVLVGLLMKLFLHAQTEQLLKTALVVGFCGGFTTFSTFSNETIGLFAGGEYGRAFIYIVASLVVCLAGTALAMRVGPTLNP